jgi:hypothetical protein
MATSIKDKIIEKISGSAEVVSDSVIATIVNAEVARRASIVVAGIKKLDETTAAKAKLEASDHSYFDADKIEVKGFSAKRIADQKEISETLNSIEKAIEACLTTNDDNSYKTLDKLNKAQGQGEGNTYVVTRCLT